VTSHGLTLLYVAANPDATIRQIADALELTERRVTDIVRELAQAELVIISREGRRNRYSLNHEARFRHPLVADIPFRAFVRLWRWSQKHEVARRP
jgi:DNA-binding transcriptional ArsR family regulator